MGCLLTEPLLLAILSATDEGIHVVSPSGVTIFYNAAAARIDGLSPDEVMGRHVLAVFPSLSAQTSTLLQVLETRRPLLNQQQTFTNVKGHRITTVNSTFPLYVGDRMAGAVEISKDITTVRALAETVWDLQAELLGGHRRGQGPGGARYTFASLLGADPALRAVLAKAERAAQGPAPVLVSGETGTGKELLVHAIHNASPRRDRPFVAQNCAALPEGLLEGILFGTARGAFTGAEDRPGLFELAAGGTLFLDEIHSLPPGLQAKLLRVLQDGRVRRVGAAAEKTVDVRIMAACNADPVAAVEAGTLRRDLFHRINVVHLELPPLRARRGDIPLLCTAFIEKHRARLGTPAQRLAPAVLAFFQSYHWPGNVRELEHAIEGALAVAAGEEVGLEDLPIHLPRGHGGDGPEPPVGQVEPAAPVEPAPPVGAEPPLRSVLLGREREVIVRALAEHGGNVARTARALGLPRQTLQYRIKVLGLRR